MKKWFFVAVLLAAIAAAGGFYYLNKPHRSVADETGILVSADSLFSAFATNEIAANARYLNAVLRVEGIIKSVERNTENKQVIVLDAGDPMFGVNCTLENEAEVKEGQVVVIKGVCTGYLADVVITQGLIEK